MWASKRLSRRRVRPPSPRETAAPFRSTPNSKTVPFSISLSATSPRPSKTLYQPQHAHDFGGGHRMRLPDTPGFCHFSRSRRSSACLATQKNPGSWEAVTFFGDNGSGQPARLTCMTPRRPVGHFHHHQEDLDTPWGNCASMRGTWRRRGGSRKVNPTRHLVGHPETDCSASVKAWVSK